MTEKQKGDKNYSIRYIDSKFMNFLWNIEFRTENKYDPYLIRDTVNTFIESVIQSIIHYQLAYFDCFEQKWITEQV